MELVPKQSRKERKKKKQREKTAEKDVDPYFGDLTKAKPALQGAKAVPNYQSTAAQLSELFPTAERKLIDLLLEENHGNFDIVLEALLKISNDVPAEHTAKEAEPPPRQTVTTSTEEKKTEVTKVLDTVPSITESKLEHIAESKVQQPLLYEEVKEPLQEESALPPTKGEEEIVEDESHTEEYKNDINESALDTVASNYVFKHPR